MANNSTDKFKATIKAYLDKRAEQDPLFKACYAKPNKSLDECCRFIIGEVYAMNKCGVTNQETFGLAVHYYNEDNIKVKALPANCYGVGITHTMGNDNTPMKPKGRGKGASKPTTPQKPNTTTPPKSTTPTPQKPTQPSKPSAKPSTTAKPQYAASLFDLWQGKEK